MKIVHLSFAIMNTQKDPIAWLNKLDFFTGILINQAAQADVHSIHCIDFQGVIVKERVTYHFRKLNRWERYFSVSLNRYVSNLVPNVLIVHGLLYPIQLILLRSTLPSTTKIFIQHHAERPLNFIKALFQKSLDKYIRGYFFTSKLLAEPWIKSGQISNPSKIFEVVEISSGFELIEKDLAYKQTKVKGSPIYLWVGRMDANKDPYTAVRAFIQFLVTCPEASLYVIYQTNDIIDHVKLLLRGYEQNIKLVGKVDHEFMKYWYNSADFIISTSHYEAGGTAVSEAMSCGCIPILTDIPSFKVLTNEGACGRLFAPGDDHALSQALSWSTLINVEAERNKVMEQFSSMLSFKAIATKINAIVMA